MARVFLGRVAALAVSGCLAFGAIAAVETPSEAQVSVKCWREYCVKDPATGLDKCAKEQIPCPNES